MTTLRWGLLAAGAIARAFATGLQQTNSGEVVSVAARNGDDASKFANEFDVPRAHEGYDALIADPSVDAIYLSTPHNHHAEWAIKAANAGKHILCEKPITVNLADADSVINAARGNRITFMEAFMYRTHPQMGTLRDLIASGEIGEVRFIDAKHGFNAGPNFNLRVTDKALAGGGILDVGCYPMSFCRLVAGMATHQPFVNPTSVRGIAQINPDYGIDEWATASLAFEGGLAAQISTAVQVTLRNQATVFGSRGSIIIHSPWGGNGRQAGETKLSVFRPGQPTEEKLIPLDRGIYAQEADMFARAVQRGETEVTAMTWEDTLGNMAALDTWRREVGLTYDFE